MQLLKFCQVKLESYSDYEDLKMLKFQIVSIYCDFLKPIFASLSLFTTHSQTKDL